jgi:hypothetical protein
MIPKKGGLMRVDWVVLAVAVAVPVSEPPLAQVATTPGQVSQLVLQMPDSLQARMLAAIGRGDIVGAIAMWELRMGRKAPEWLLAFQNAFSTNNQRAGPCVEVARSIFEGFKRLSAKPSYVRFTAQGSRFLGFEMRAGDPRSTVQVSEMRIHVVVQVEDRFYDAFTGPTGLPVAEYVKRLLTEEGATITSQVIASL